MTQNIKKPISFWSGSEFDFNDCKQTTFEAAYIWTLLTEGLIKWSNVIIVGLELETKD
jgi:hypothetical protein